VAPDPGSEAWGCIVQLFRSAENERRFHDVAESLGLTPRMLGGIMHLVPGEAKPMRAMVEEWHCDPSWITTIVDEFEQRGLVERRVDGTDRRAKTVHLTALGEKVRTEAVRLLSVPPPGIAKLAVSDQVALRDLLRQVTSDLPPLR